MREKYESLPLTELRAVAKARGMKNISTLRKPELVDAMCKQDELDAAKASSAEKEARDKEAKPEGAKRGRPKRTDEKSSATKSATKPAVKAVSKPVAKAAGEDTPAETEAPAKEMKPAESVKPAGERTQAEGSSQTEGKSIPEEMTGAPAHGILEVITEGFGFIRSANYLPGDADVYVSPAQIRKFGLKTGDVISGVTRVKNASEKFGALMYINSVNGFSIQDTLHRCNFEDMTPIFPDERLHLETQHSPVSMRIVDLVSPIGKGQRGMIVSPPKAGKTTLLKQVAKAIQRNHPEMHMIILLIDERPEEVTDMKESVVGDNVEIIYSTFDELPEHHKRVAEMVMERAKRLVEHKKDVMILLDSITRLARAYNLTVPPSGRTLSGGLDPAALHMPKKFFGAARNMREGGSLTILATALVDTGSKMDDVVYEEFKGTGNMELVLDRKLSEKRVFPAIDIVRSSTRREDLLLDESEQAAVDIMRKEINGMKTDEAVETILNLFSRTRTNREYCEIIRKTRAPRK